MAGLGRRAIECRRTGVVLADAQPAFVKAGEKEPGQRIALVGGAFIPSRRRTIIGRTEGAGLIEIALNGLRRRVARLGQPCRFVEPGRPGRAGADMGRRTGRERQDREARPPQADRMREQGCRGVQKSLTRPPTSQSP